MVALKQGSVPDVIANKLDHLLILTSGTEQYLITCTNKKYKFLLTTTLTISVSDKIRYAYALWNFNQHMHVIWAYFCFYNFYTFSFA